MTFQIWLWFEPCAKYVRGAEGRKRIVWGRDDLGHLLGCIQAATLPWYRRHSPGGKLVHPVGHICLLVFLAQCIHPTAADHLDSPGSCITRLGSVDFPCQDFWPHTGSSQVFKRSPLPVWERMAGHTTCVTGFLWGVYMSQLSPGGCLLVFSPFLTRMDRKETPSSCNKPSAWL